MAWNREQMAARAAEELHDGCYVNLGIGLPARVADHVPAGLEVWLHSANGLLGTEPGASDKSAEAEADGVIVPALPPGSSFFGTDQGFAMIRAGRVDLAILGAMQVSQRGDLANWMIPGKKAKGMGGAMDLVAGAKRVIVLMEHVAQKKDGTTELKILPECTLPLTGAGVVDRIITDLGVMDVTPAGLSLVELADGVTFDEIQSKTAVPLLV